MPLDNSEGAGLEFRFCAHSSQFHQSPPGTPRPQAICSLIRLPQPSGDSRRVALTPPINLTFRSTHFGTRAPLPEMDARSIMDSVSCTSYRGARGIRKTAEKERQMQNKMALKKALFVVMLGILTLPAIASAKPVKESHNVTPARKAHFTKLHNGR